MTVVAVLADPPRDGVVLPRLPETSPLSASEATELYEAMLKDVVAAVSGSGADLLVNYRDDGDLPESDERSAAQLRAVVADALGSSDDVRFEVQVGSSFSARAGNTVTHLLEQEAVRSVAVVTPAVPTLGRKEIDNAAMKLRRNEVVLGPSDGGCAYYAGFTDAIDFEDAYAPPALETLTHRGVDAGHDVDFLPQLPVVETGRDLASVVSLVRARTRAERVIPEHTATAIADLGLTVESTDGAPAIRRE
jgi:2-phospho-L-lactate guanylyltransferase (CobY/MobA/RfbA family)